MIILFKFVRAKFYVYIPWRPRDRWREDASRCNRGPGDRDCPTPESPVRELAAQAPVSQWASSRTASRWQSKAVKKERVR